MKNEIPVVLLACGFLAGGCSPAPEGESGNAETAAATAEQEDAMEMNTLSAAERAAGWTLLFDGETTAGWRGYQQDSMPAGWQAENGMLTRVADGSDIITTEQYGDFELSLEWKVAPGGNSGVLYHVTEEGDQTYHTGPEMQILDDAAHPDGASRLTAAGSAYGLYPAPAGVVMPAGEWNQSRVVVSGPHVEHWLNGQKVVEYELWSDDWETRVSESKFSQWPGYGRSESGHIALQAHGSDVWYRNIKIR